MTLYIQHYTKLCDNNIYGYIRHYTTLYNVIQDYQNYDTIYTRVYMTDYTKLHNVMQHYIRHYIRLYDTIQC